jgi:Ca2+-binding RTX toxin-like protein
VTGNVLGNDSFGADGGHIQSIVIGGVTHTSAEGTHITVTTSIGGSLTFYFADDGSHHAGDYAYSAPASVNADKTETFHYTLVDNDGDTAGADLQVVVKNVLHAPTSLDLAAIDDTGSSNSDNITNHTTGLTISGNADNGTTVTLFEDANNNGVFDGGDTVLAATIGVISGAFSADIALAEGTHHIAAFETDGVTTSPASAVLDITVDTTPPVPVITGFTNDSGTVGDHLTNDTTLTINGSADPNTTVTLFRDGTSLGTANVDGSGHWTYNDSATLLNGHTYLYAASETDAAGNVGTSAAYAATIDTSDPNIPSNLSIIHFDNPFTVPEAALLALVTDASAIDISGYSSLSNLTLSDLGASIQINDQSGNSRFNFTVEDAAGNNSTSGRVNVSQDTSGNTLNGDDNNNILVDNNSAHTLTGGNGNDVLIGNGGADTLTGGAGADHFFYNAPTDGGVGGDHITDFSGSGAGGDHDLIDLLSAAFGGGSGAIASSDLIQVTSAQNPATIDMGSAHFAYQQSTGTLYYDANGGGADASRMVLAILDNHAAIAATDIHKV